MFRPVRLKLAMFIVRPSRVCSFFYICHRTCRYGLSLSPGVDPSHVGSLFYLCHVNHSTKRHTVKLSYNLVPIAKSKPVVTKCLTVPQKLEKKSRSLYRWLGESIARWSVMSGWTNRLIRGKMDDGWVCGWLDGRTAGYKARWMSDLLVGTLEWLRRSLDGRISRCLHDWIDGCR